MAELQRIQEANDMKRHWRRWGPYLSEREWATVREDYSHNGDAWASFPFEHSHLRAYRWGEDGIAGISDNHQMLCFSLAMWNGKDDRLKERLFGVTGPQGNHGEDVKECYYYLDNTPTHSYMKYLYKYPQAAFPYKQLVEESLKRSRKEEEYELKDTGLFDNNEYFDVFVEYAKSDVDDILIKITAHNRASTPATLHLLPHLWFRNRWSWDDKNHFTTSQTDDEGAGDTAYADWCRDGNPQCSICPNVSVVHGQGNDREFALLKSEHGTLKRFLALGNAIVRDSIGVERDQWSFDSNQQLLFTGNDTNLKTLYYIPNVVPYVKDGINQRVVYGNHEAVNGTQIGSKSAIWYHGVVSGQGSVEIRLRLSDYAPLNTRRFLTTDFDKVFADRRNDADEFYKFIQAPALSDDLKNIQRQAFAGMLWSKQFYHYVIKEWLEGDPGQPPPPPDRKHGRNKVSHTNTDVINSFNKDWKHLYVDDILSMPDKWEYPFFACWDTAFHAVTLAQIDPWFAKKQLTLMTREWYLHPNGQLPAYEWNFSDVNPPVHAWAALRVFRMEKKIFGTEDRLFLERTFQKLLLNFTWWVNRKDHDGLNVFEGGFLGLDNIAVFNRSEALPIGSGYRNGLVGNQLLGGRLRQADGTSWMAMFCLNMLDIALELAPMNVSYEDIASKFFEHFLYISDALSWQSDDGVNSALWHEEDGFFYDNVVFNDGRVVPLKVRSLVGLVPLFAVLVLEPPVLKQCPGFKKRMDWFLENFDFTKRNVTKFDGEGQRLLLSLVPTDRLKRVLGYLFDEEEFLSPYGIRSLSKYHATHPYIFWVHDQQHRVDFLPSESDSGLFGGNSNWRGPIWMPTTFLLIESLQRFHHYYGDSLKVECPTRSNNLKNLDEAADIIMHRCIRIFSKSKQGKRAFNGGVSLFDHNEHFRDCILFHEFFHSENAKGLGASHQTGWTGIISKMIQKAGLNCEHG